MNPSAEFNATTGLTGAIVFYAITTMKLYRGSKSQLDALKELTEAILQLPEIAQGIERQGKLREELMEMRIRQITIDQEKLLKGR